MSVASPPKKSSKLPSIVVGIVLLGLVCAGMPVVVLGVLGVSMYWQSTGEVERLGGPITVEDLPPIEINASVMVSDYREDAAVANSKFKDKAVQVTGAVAKIEGQWVELEGQKNLVGGGADRLRVRVYFNDQDKGKMATLTKGQKITVNGKCVGKSSGDSIDVNNCVLVK